MFTCQPFYCSSTRDEPVLVRALAWNMCVRVLHIRSRPRRQLHPSGTTVFSPVQRHYKWAPAAKRPRRLEGIELWLQRGPGRGLYDPLWVVMSCCVLWHRPVHITVSALPEVWNLRCAKHKSCPLLRSQKGQTSTNTGWLLTGASSTVQRKDLAGDFCSLFHVVS